MLEVGTSHFGVSVKKVVFFQNLDILYRKSYSKFDGFWWLSLNLVVFLQIPRNMWSLQLQESIVRRIFIDFGKLFFKVVIFSVESSFLSSITILGAGQKNVSTGKLFCSAHRKIRWRRYEFPWAAGTEISENPQTVCHFLSTSLSKHAR